MKKDKMVLRLSRQALKHMLEDSDFEIELTEEMQIAIFKALLNKRVFKLPEMKKIEKETEETMINSIEEFFQKFFNEKWNIRRDSFKQEIDKKLYQIFAVDMEKRMTEIYLETKEYSVNKIRRHCDKALEAVDKKIDEIVDKSLEQIINKKMEDKIRRLFSL